MEMMGQMQGQMQEQGQQLDPAMFDRMSDQEVFEMYVQFTQGEPAPEIVQIFENPDRVEPEIVAQARELMIQEMMNG